MGKEKHFYVKKNKNREEMEGQNKPGVALRTREQRD